MASLRAAGEADRSLEPAAAQKPPAQAWAPRSSVERCLGGPADGGGHRSSASSQQPDGSIMPSLKSDCRCPEHVLQLASEEERGDRAFVLRTLRKDECPPEPHKGAPFYSSSMRFLAGREQDVMVLATPRHGSVVRHASRELRKDPGVVLAASARNGRALRWGHAHSSVRGDEALVLAAVSGNCHSLRGGPAHLRMDPEFAEKAVLRSGLALQHVSSALREDRDTAGMAVAQDGLALRFAAQELRADRAVVLCAVRQNGAALQYACSDLRKDRLVVLAAVGSSGIALEHAGAVLAADREVVMTAVRQNGTALKFAARPLRCDLEVVMAAVASNGLSLEFAGVAARSDKEVVTAAVSQCGMALKFAGRALRADLRVVALADATTPGAAKLARGCIRGLPLHRSPD